MKVAKEIESVISEWDASADLDLKLIQKLLLEAGVVEPIAYGK